MSIFKKKKKENRAYDSNFMTQNRFVMSPDSFGSLLSEHKQLFVHGHIRNLLSISSSNESSRQSRKSETQSGVTPMLLKQIMVESGVNSFIDMPRCIFWK